MELIYGSVRSSSRKGGDGVKELDVFRFIIVNRNMVQHPSNNISNYVDKIIIFKDP